MITFVYGAMISAALAVILAALYLLRLNQPVHTPMAVLLGLLSIALMLGAILLRHTILSLREKLAQLLAKLEVSKDQFEKLSVSIKAETSERQKAEEKLQQTLGNLKRAQDEAAVLASALKQTSFLCPVTGLINQRHFETVLDIEWRRLMRDKKPFTLIMFEVDEKLRNLPPSKTSLKRLAKVLKDFARRGGDLAIRYSDTVFGLLLIGTDTRNGALLAEKLRKKITALKMAYSEFQPNALITLHTGVATIIPSHYTGSQDLIKRADAALYESRFQGGNKVVCYRSLDPFRIEPWNAKIDGLLTEERLLKKLIDWGFDATLREYSPEAKIPDYSSELETVHAVLTGQLRLTTDGQPLNLKPGDSVFLPPGTTSSIEAVGNEPVFMFEATKEPILEQTAAINDPRQDI